MSVDYKTNITVDLGFEKNPDRPVTTYSESLGDAKCASSHFHPRSQLIFSRNGIIKVICQNQMWMVNNTQAIWIPKNVEHQVFFPKTVELVSVFIDSSVPILENKCFAFKMYPFLEQLILKLVQFQNPQKANEKHLRLVQVFFDELSELIPTTFFLPLNSDCRIEKITNILMEDISERKNLDYYANLINVSPRTLSRLFKNKLGLSFRDWRLRLKLLEAVRMLGDGLSTKEIAFNLGYENPSTFIYIFHKHFKKTPSNFRKSE